MTMGQDAAGRITTPRSILRDTTEGLNGSVVACLAGLVAVIVLSGAGSFESGHGVDFRLIGFAGLCVTTFLLAGRIRSRSLRRALRIAPLAAIAFLFGLVCIPSVPALIGLAAAAFDSISAEWNAAVSSVNAPPLVARVMSSLPDGFGWGSAAIVAFLLATGRSVLLSAYIGCKAAMGILLPTIVQMAASVASFSPIKKLFENLGDDVDAKPALGLVSFLLSPGERLDRIIHPYTAAWGLDWLSCPTLDQIFFLVLAWTARNSPLRWPAAAAAVVALLWSTEESGQYVTASVVGAGFAFALMAVAVAILAAFLRDATAAHDDAARAAEDEALQARRFDAASRTAVAARHLSRAHAPDLPS